MLWQAGVPCCYRSELAVLPGSNAESNHVQSLRMWARRDFTNGIGYQDLTKTTSNEANLTAEDRPFWAEHMTCRNAGHSFPLKAVESNMNHLGKEYSFHAFVHTCTHTLPHTRTATHMHCHTQTLPHTQTATNTHIFTDNREWKTVNTSQAYTIIPPMIEWTRGRKTDVQTDSQCLSQYYLIIYMFII